jgi:hypothetical protein
VSVDGDVWVRWAAGGLQRCAVGTRNEMSGLDRAAGCVQDKIHLTYDGQK